MQKGLEMPTEIPVMKRRFDLDWLRVLAILVVFLFHSGRFFDQWDWHVKNPATYAWVQTWSMFLVSWMMPLIFVISGGSLNFSLIKPGKFIKDKVLRLLVPFVVGVFSHVALGVYLERLTHYQFSGSIVEFIPRYFQGLYGEGGNFAWMGLHLWYLLVLFVFSLLFLPLFLLLKGPAKRLTDWFGRVFALPGMVYLLALPVICISASIDPSSILGERSWGGWSLAGYAPFFLYGFLLLAHEGLQESVKRWRWGSLALALICTAFLASVYDQHGGAAYGSRGYTLVNGLFGLNAWLWVLAIFGFGMRNLNFQTPLLRRANEAVLPFYILHQTVLLGIGYYVTRWNIPDFVKFLLISASSFMIIVSLYELLIRRINILRVLFGMKPKAEKPIAGAAIPNRTGLETGTR